MMDRTFEQVWLDILDFAKRRIIVKTLVRKEENEIFCIDNVSIAVELSTIGNERVLRKRDFQFAWTYLKSKKEITLQNIKPFDFWDAPEDVKVSTWWMRLEKKRQREP